MAPALFVGLVYGLFFLSGAAALVYQVVWVRSLTLVFGGSHLAVTAVLSIFMAGLALGGYIVGRYVDHARNPLRLYGLLELGIAASALAFVGLMTVYPSMYVALARGRDDATVYLTVIRMLFSVVALIVPTTLMGGTLPVLSRFVSRQPERLRVHLSFLYAVNTLGAVFGAIAAGFFLIRALSVSATLYVAVAANVAIGLVSLWLQRTSGGASGATDAWPPGETPAPVAVSPHEAPDTNLDVYRVRLVLWGIGVSGFCALGYEVLWTRVLSIAIGASVYGFTIILVAFLTGIALGSQVHGLLGRYAVRTPLTTRQVIARFGLTQVVIGMAALLVTVFLRDIPGQSIRLQVYFLGGSTSFPVRAWANFLLAFGYMVVPAFFMGVAFPLAGEAVARYRRAVGHAVGEVLSYNTVGAILGAAVSGLVLIRAFGIERSLQMLTALNIGTGLLVLSSLRPSRWLRTGVVSASLAVLAFLALNDTAARAWDSKYFAIFRANQPEVFSTPALVRDALENTDVLYYAEGVESTVSVIKVKGGEQAFITNGRVEASSYPQGQQVQYTLGHLPVLLNRDPKEVLVVGMGSGMTAGATVVHPGVERVTLVELEPSVQGVARTFAEYNHNVLDHTKLEVVFNDGRNFLLTTEVKFDVITADPIHPWFRGAGYLYSADYFALAKAHLRPGGVVAQWLPIYELTPRDLATVVRTFQQHFAHTMLWLTHFDAEIVGSDTPFVIDEADLQRRIAEPEIARDLERVTMGSAADLLGFFVMGTDGMRRFAEAEGGVVNTDDRPYLEFTAPFSFATPGVMATNVRALTTHRESILPFLKPETDATARQAQLLRWNRQLEAARLGDPGLALLLGGRQRDPALPRLLARLTAEYPEYSPGRALQNEYWMAARLEPRLLQQASFATVGADGSTTMLEVSAVLAPVGPTRGAVMFVDNRAREVYGQLYADARDRDAFAARFAAEVMTTIRTAYDEEVARARARGQAHASTADVQRLIRALVNSKTQDIGGSR